MASTPSHLQTKEALFKSKLSTLGLQAVFKERTREQYGVTQYRLEIKIHRHGQELAFTTGGYWGVGSYRESGFEQGLRKLAVIEKAM